jgi:hypothetical protein
MQHDGFQVEKIDSGYDVPGSNQVSGRARLQVSGKNTIQYGSLLYVLSRAWGQKQGRVWGVFAALDLHQGELLGARSHLELESPQSQTSFHGGSWSL